MEKDFHFFITYALAETSGFTPEEALTVAYASQYVDDNNERQYPDKDGIPTFPSAIRVNGGFFRPIMTQSMSVKSLVYEIQKYIYVPFHFLPGDANQLIKGKLNKYSTTPNSSNAQKLLKSALQSGDPYRIGIAVHTYADTWTHQNFTGYEEKWNSVFTWSSPYRAIVPNIGHADVGHAADEISIEWKDHRLAKPERRINNRQRVLEACKHIYQALRSAKKGSVYWTEVKTDFKRIIDVEDYEDRLDEVRAFVNNPDLAYENNKWVDEAINRVGDEWKANPDFENSHWLKFQQAAKANLALVVDTLKLY